MRACCLALSGLGDPVRCGHSARYQSTEWCCFGVPAMGVSALPAFGVRFCSALDQATDLLRPLLMQVDESRALKLIKLQALRQELAAHQETVAELTKLVRGLEHELGLPVE